MRTPKFPAEWAGPNRRGPRRSHQRERDPSTPLRDRAERQCPEVRPQQKRRPRTSPGSPRAGAPGTRPQCRWCCSRG
eukprot:12506627-Alexandrium_andersonii.AAC.1